MSPHFLSLQDAATQPASLETEKPIGIAASLSDVPKAMETGRLDPLRPRELSRAQEPAPSSGEKARLSEAPGSKKSLSMLHSIRGSAPKDTPVPLSHSINGKSKPWEPFVAEEFAHQFHESVLQSTQKALQKHKGNAAARLPCAGSLAAAEHGRAGAWGGALHCGAQRQPGSLRTVPGGNPAPTAGLHPELLICPTRLVSGLLASSPVRPAAQ